MYKWLCWHFLIFEISLNRFSALMGVSFLCFDLEKNRLLWQTRIFVFFKKSEKLIFC